MLSLSNLISIAGRLIYPSLLWNFNIKEKVIYLTFDDGPIPEVTPWVLNNLKCYNAKATFFCIGDNISKHPEIFQMILDEGHSAGNHSYNHLNGWKTDNGTYISNILKADSVLSEFQAEIIPNSKLDGKLFRPPYGRIKLSQIKEIQAKNFKIVMWDVISGDYDKQRSPQKCFKEVTNYARPGSIIVLHDSLKAFKNLQVILPAILKFYSAKGFEFRSL